MSNPSTQGTWGENEDERMGFEESDLMQALEKIALVEDEVGLPDRTSAVGHSEPSAREELSYAIAEEFLEDGKFSEALEWYANIPDGSFYATPAACRMVTILMVHRGCAAAREYALRLIQRSSTIPLDLAYEIARVLQIGGYPREALSLFVVSLWKAKSAPESWLNRCLAHLAAGVQAWPLALQYLYQYLQSTHGRQSRPDVFVDYGLQRLWTHLASADDLKAEHWRYARNLFAGEILASVGMKEFDGKLCLEWFGRLPPEFSGFFIPDVRTHTLRLRPDAPEEVKWQIADWYEETKARNLRHYFMGWEASCISIPLAGLFRRNGALVPHLGHAQQALLSGYLRESHEGIAAIDSFLRAAANDGSLFNTSVVLALSERSIVSVELRIIQRLLRIEDSRSDSALYARMAELDEILRIAGEDCVVLNVESVSAIIERCELAADLRFREVARQMSLGAGERDINEFSLRELDDLLWTAGREGSLVTPEVIHAVIARAERAVDKRILLAV